MMLYFFIFCFSAEIKSLSTQSLVQRDAFMKSASLSWRKTVKNQRIGREFFRGVPFHKKDLFIGLFYEKALL